MRFVHGNPLLTIHVCFYIVYHISLENHNYFFKIALFPLDIQGLLSVSRDRIDVNRCT